MSAYSADELWKSEHCDEKYTEGLNIFMFFFKLTLNVVLVIYLSQAQHCYLFWCHKNHEDQWNCHVMCVKRKS